MKIRWKRVIFILAIIFIFIFPFIINAKGKTEKRYSKVTVYPGDTLWTIAKENKTSKDIRKTIYEIRKANHLDSAVIIPGQELIIPLD